MTQHLRIPLWIRLAAGCSILGLTVPASAQTTEYGYYDDEEWYDPSDWFDGDDYDFEYYDADDAWDMDSYAWDDSWNQFTWESAWDYDYDYDSYDNRVSDSGSIYDYNDGTGVWESVTPNFTTGYAYYPYGYTYVFTAQPLGENTGSQDRAGQSSDRQGSSGQQSAQFSSQEFRGTVQAFRHTELDDREGSTSTYSLAKVKLDNGRTIVMSLGEKSRLDRLDLEKGDQVTITGATGQIGGKNIIIAERVRANGQSVRVNARVARAGDKMDRNRDSSRSTSGDRYARNQDRASRDPGSEGSAQGRERMSGDQYRSNQNDYAQGGDERYDRNTQRYNRNTDNRWEERRNRASSNRNMQSGQMNQDERMTLAGTVADFHSTRVDGSRERQKFARIELENGRSATVLLGSDKSASQLGLQDGDYVFISGTRDEIDGRTVLRAQTIRVEGEKVDLSSR